MPKYDISLRDLLAHLDGRGITIEDERSVEEALLEIDESVCLDTTVSILYRDW